MIDRYSKDSKIKEIFSDESKYKYWLKIEKSLFKVLRNNGVITNDCYKALNEIDDLSLDKIIEKEKLVKHDVIAFIEYISEISNNECVSRFIHYGLTSSDVVDTALSLQIIDSSKILIDEFDKLRVSLMNFIYNTYDIKTVGRTHGQHASITSFGLKFSKMLKVLEVNFGNFINSVSSLKNCCNMSGPVGDFSSLHKSMSCEICDELSLKVDLSSTQIIDRSFYANVFTSLAIFISTIERISVNLRNLSRTEIGEVYEGFSHGQKGSSSMPHKKNPIGLENISGLSRIVRSNMMAFMENIILWDERDISHSSVERILVPDTFILSEYIIKRFSSIINSLVVNLDRISDNYKISRNSNFSDLILSSLVLAGMNRKQAYEEIQKCAFSSGDFINNVLSSSVFSEYITNDDVKRILDFNPNKYLKLINEILLNEESNNKL